MAYGIITFFCVDGAPVPGDPVDAQQAAIPPREGVEQHKAPDSKVQGILLCKVTTSSSGGRAAEIAPLPHSTKGNTHFYLGIFPHVYQPEFDPKGIELLEALYSCKTKQSQQHRGQHNLR